jgi:glycosyltransferase involved in cell wall biosynthesis
LTRKHAVRHPRRRFQLAETGNTSVTDPNPEGATGASETILIYAPVPLHRAAGGGYLMEDQACNGLRLWAENFERVIVMHPLSPEAPPPAWVPVERIGPALSRIEIVALPMAYRPDVFLRSLGAVRRQIRELISRADYLGFSIGGLFGDWGSVGALEAHRMGRPFYVWTDRVESEVVRRTAESAAVWRHRLRARLTHVPMARLERHIIRRAALGLFHGRDTYDTYSPFSRAPELVHDIHIGREDHIPAERLAAKIAAAQSGSGPLEIVYLGRAAAMKGPFDWVATLERLAAAGVDFRATWLGDGPDHEALVARINAASLAGRVSAPGFTRDRAEVLEALRRAHLLLFCHKTPESPRCLIEALISGTPIIGYGSAFPRDLVASHGGGLFVEPGDVEGLARMVESLAMNRERLARLIGSAAQDGAPFTDEEVFRHRAELIKRYLGNKASASAHGGPLSARVA